MCEWEFSLLTCCDSRFLSVCFRCLLSENRISEFKLIWFKTHDFSAISMIIRDKTDVSAGMSFNGSALFWKRGRGAAAHFNLKRHAQKQCVSASTQNRHFQYDKINYLWGILSWNFTDTFWGHQRLILHITLHKKGHNMSPLIWTFYTNHQLIQ